MHTEPREVWRARVGEEAVKVRLGGEIAQRFAAWVDVHPKGPTGAVREALEPLARTFGDAPPGPGEDLPRARAALGLPLAELCRLAVTLWLTPELAGVAGGPGSRSLPTEALPPAGARPPARVVDHERRVGVPAGGRTAFFEDEPAAVVEGTGFDPWGW